MRIQRRQLLGIGLTSLATLNLEIVLTRVFSVTMWYHFAFLSISLALMGSAIAGAVLYFFPRLTRPDVAQRWIRRLALALILSVPVTFLLYLQIPLQIDQLRGGFPALQVFWLLLIYLDLTVPFLLSGLILSLTISTWSEQAGQVYWADLTGAALGCLGSILTLEVLGGVGAVVIVGAIAGLAGWVFTWGHRREQALALLATLLVIALVWGNARQGWLTISVDKTGGEEPPRLYERWNTHSRVTVYEVSRYPFLWSVSTRLWDKIVEEGHYLYHALLLIDAMAGTPVQEFRGDLSEVEFLTYDQTSFVYHLLDGPRTLVIGPGGGRDVLAALVAGAPHVTAVEINPAVVAAVRGPFAEFTHHLYDRPDVTVAVADARGYITRSPDRYDVIQASLIDTVAAGSSGAFALSENSLYTTEAFQTYYDHLTDRGILTISRWYRPGDPAEMLRLVSTGMAGWVRAGVADPRRYVAVVTHPKPGETSAWLATALFKRAPFTPQEVAELEAQAAELDLAILYAPGLPVQEKVGEFIAAEDHAAEVAAYPLDVSPATDDRPFFFNMVLFGDLFDPSLMTAGGHRIGRQTIMFLALVLAVTAVLGVLFILLPLWLASRRRGLARPPLGLLIYFSALGAAFMLVEIPTIQRLTVYLGRPIYSLAVVLFSLLLSSGMGGLYTSRRPEALSRRMRWLFPLLVALIALHAAAGAWLLLLTIGWSLLARLAVTIALLVPLGFLMGMPFPQAMRWAGEHRPGVVPWLWGINGVTSVLGSALSTALAIHTGFRVVLLVAAGLYGVAGAALAQQVRSTD